MSAGQACCWCLSNCCMIYGLMGTVVLAWFGYLIQTESLTFQLAKAKTDNPADFDYGEKATACFTAAGLYAATFVVSVISRKALAGRRAALEDEE